MGHLLGSAQNIAYGAQRDPGDPVFHQMFVSQTRAVPI